jgi:hypothetical protein
VVHANTVQQRDGVYSSCRREEASIWDILSRMIIWCPSLIMKETALLLYSSISPTSKLELPTSSPSIILSRR